MNLKKRYRTVWCTYTLVSLSALTAIYLILSRFLAINIGGFGRIQLGVIARIMAGIWFGPFAGAVCGLASDLLGCLIQGYAVNPLITFAAILWGVIPALFVPYQTAPSFPRSKKEPSSACAREPSQPVSSVRSLSQPRRLSGSTDIISMRSFRPEPCSSSYRRRSIACLSACCISARLRHRSTGRLRPIQRGAFPDSSRPPQAR